MSKRLGELKIESNRRCKQYWK